MKKLKMVIICLLLILAAAMTAYTGGAYGYTNGYHYNLVCNCTDNAADAHVTMSPAKPDQVVILYGSKIQIATGVLSQYSRMGILATSYPCPSGYVLTAAKAETTIGTTLIQCVGR